MGGFLICQCCRLGWRRGGQLTKIKWPPVSSRSVGGRVVVDVRRSIKRTLIECGKRHGRVVRVYYHCRPVISRRRLRTRYGPCVYDLRRMGAWVPRPIRKNRLCCKTRRAHYIIIVDTWLFTISFLSFYFLLLMSFLLLLLFVVSSIFPHRYPFHPLSYSCL